MSALSKFREKDMAQVGLLFAKSQNEIVGLQARVAELEAAWRQLRTAEPSYDAHELRALILETADSILGDRV